MIYILHWRVTSLPFKKSTAASFACCFLTSKIWDEHIKTTGVGHYFIYFITGLKNQNKLKMPAIGTGSPTMQCTGYIILSMSVVFMMESPHVYNNRTCYAQGIFHLPFLDKILPCCFNRLQKVFGRITHQTNIHDAAKLFHRPGNNMLEGYWWYPLLPTNNSKQQLIKHMWCTGSNADIPETRYIVMKYNTILHKVQQLWF